MASLQFPVHYYERSIRHQILVERMRASPPAFINWFCLRFERSVGESMYPVFSVFSQSFLPSTRTEIRPTKFATESKVAYGYVARISVRYDRRPVLAWAITTVSIVPK